MHLKFKRTILLLLIIIIGLTQVVLAVDEGSSAAPKKMILADKEILELGKDPGFSLRRLHKDGITGKGIGIAIIDGHLISDHVEYSERLKKVIKMDEKPSDLVTIHGTAVASIAVGKNVGVAPGADLYFFEFSDDYSIATFESNVYKAVEEIVRLNKTLPKKNRIRVISMSAFLPPRDKTYIKAIDLAKKEGIFFVSCSTKIFYNFHYIGLKRNPENDPNLTTSYEPIDWESYSFVDNDYYFKRSYPKGELLFLPYDSKTTASQKGPNEYAFHKTGCPSWEAPFLAGLYALACQVNSEVDPELFWKEALATGSYIEYEAGKGKNFVGKIINPTKLMQKLKEDSIMKKRKAGHLADY